MARASVVLAAPHLTWIEIGMCRVIVERERRTVSELGVCARVRVLKVFATAP